MEEAWTEGTVLGLSRRICKDPTLRNDRVPTPIPPGMFGKPIEAEIKRKENSSSFRHRIDKPSHYTKELSQEIEIKALDQNLEIMCAEGTQLPYEEYI